MEKKFRVKKVVNFIARSDRTVSVAMMMKALEKALQL